MLKADDEEPGSSMGRGYQTINEGSRKKQTRDSITFITCTYKWQLTVASTQAPSTKKRYGEVNEA